MKNEITISEGNKAYRAGDYNKARMIYKSLLNQGGITSKLAQDNLKLVSKKIDFDLLDHENLEPILRSLKSSDGNLIITYPIIPWDFRIQRPQHLVSRLSKQGFTSLYIANVSPPKIPTTDEDIINHLGTRELAAGVHEIWLQTEQGFNMYKSEITGNNLFQLSQQLKTVCNLLKPNKLIHLVQFPGWFPLAEKVRNEYGGVIVYDCMDHHAGFSNNTGEALSQEEKLIKDANLVLASSLLLEKELKPKAKEVLLIKNATDYEHFNTHRPNGKLDYLQGPIIGYYGAIADWFDIDLIIECAKLRPKWSFVLIGATELCDTSNAKTQENIHFLGEIPYTELPGYVSYFDVCTIPFKIIPLTEATNPVKFYEYMSAGKPVVSTELPELQPYSEFVQFASTPTQFIAKLDIALIGKNDDTLKQKFQNLAIRNNWNDRISIILNHNIFSSTAENTKKNNETESNHELINQLRHWVKIKDEEIIELRKRAWKLDLTWEQFKQQVLAHRDEYKGIFIQEIIIDWNVPLFQRPQHIAKAFGRLGYLVIYKTANWGSGDNIDGVRQVAKNVWMTSLWEANEIENAVHTIYSTTYLYTPDDIPQRIKNGVIIYEYIDHIDPAISGNENIESLLAIKKWAFNGGADYIVASAQKLYDEAVTAIGKEKVILVPNGVDTSHYRSDIHNQIILPNIFNRFKRKYKIIVGYFGAIAPWLWYNMLEQLTEIRQEIGFIFIGPDYYNGVEHLPKKENLLYLGVVDYSILPAYAKEFDICFIPFMPGEIAKTTSPLKLFEYFALEKPVVVTSDMTECVAYNEVLSGNDVNSLSSALDKAITIKDSKEYKHQLKQLADNNDWSQRAKVMEKCFEGLK